MKITKAMLKKKLRKNLDLVLIILFVSIVYVGGWQTEVFGFLQRGILATGLMNAKHDEKIKANTAELGFFVSDINDEKIHVKSLHGKTIFINFWATWCPPCVAEMPEINALYNRLKDQDDIVFLMISVDQDHAIAKSYMEKKSLEFPVYFLSSPLPEVFRYQSIPTTFVISPQGKIAYQKEGMANYNTNEFKNFLINL